MYTAHLLTSLILPVLGEFWDVLPSEAEGGGETRDAGGRFPPSVATEEETMTLILVISV